jgi:hypothetical protein
MLIKSLFHSYVLHILHVITLLRMHNIMANFKSNDIYLMIVNLFKSLKDDLISNVTTSVVNININMIFITSNRV